MEKDYVEQNVKKSGFENPEFRASVIGRLVDDLNNHYKENNINIVLDKDEIIKKAKDEEAYKNHLEAKKILEDYGKRQQIQSSIDKINGVKSDSGMGRVIHYNLTIPDGTNDEEIHNKNKEIVKYYRDPNNTSEIIFQKTKDLYNLELKDFFPTSIEEVIENAKNKRPALDDAFVIKSIYENNGFTQNQTLKDNGFSYYLTTFESGDETLTALKMEASDIGYLLPNCVNLDDISNVMTGFIKYYEENDKENHQKIQEAVNLTSSSLGDEREDRFAFNKYVREFIEKKATDKDFFKKYSIGGDSFLKKMKENYENNVKVEDIEINESFKDADKGLNKYPVRSMAMILKDGKDLYNKCIDKINKNDLSVIDDLGKIPVDNNNNTALYKSHLFKRIYEKAKNNNINVSTLEENYEKAVNNLLIKAEHTNTFDLIINNDNYEKLIYDIALDGKIKYLDFHQVDMEGINDPKIEFVHKVSNLIKETKELHDKQEVEIDPIKKSKLIQEYCEKLNAHEYLAKLGLDEIGVKYNESQLSKISLEKIMESNKELPKDFYENNIDKAYKSKYGFFHEEKIKEFKEKYPNEQEKIKLIENALTVRSSDFSQNISGVSNPLEHATNMHIMQNPLKAVKNKNVNLKESLVSTSPTFTKFEPHNNALGSKDARKAQFKLSDGTKKNILYVASKMKEFGIFNPNDINEILYLKGEEGNKEYAFRYLNQAREKVRKYVEKSDFDNAVIEAKNADEITKKYDQILDIVEKSFPQDGKHISGNLSIGRNRVSLEQHVNRVQPMCQLNGMYFVLVFCKKNNIDIEKFIEEPQKYMDKVLKSKADRVNETYEAKKKDTLFNMLLPGPSQTDMISGRCLEALGALESDDTLLEDNAISQVYFQEGCIIDERQGGSFFSEKKGFDSEPLYEPLRNYMAGGDFYNASEFLTNSFDFENGEIRKSNFDYDEFINTDQRSTDKVYKDVMDKIYDTIMVAKKEDDPPFESHDISSVVACSLTYLSDYLVKKNLDPSKDKDALAIKKFIDDPIRVLYQNMRERNPKDYPEITGNTVEFGVGMNNFNTHFAATQDLRQAYNNKFIAPIENKVNEAKGQSFGDTYNNAIRANVKGNSIEFIASAKVLRDKHDSRNPFSKVFNPASWIELLKMRWVRDKAIAAGVDKTKYDRILKSDYGTNEKSMYTDIAKLKNEADSYAIEHNLIEVEPKVDINPSQNVKVGAVDNLIVDDDLFEENTNQKQPNLILIQEEVYREKVDVVNNDSSKKDDEIEFDYNRMNEFDDKSKGKGSKDENKQEVKIEENNPQVL